MITSTPLTPKPPSPRKILLIGSPGARKTTLMLQFPSLHVMNCDNNLDGPEAWIRSVMKLPLSYTYDNIRLDDKGAPLLIHDAFNRLCDKFKLVRSDPAYSSIKVVGTDSLSLVNEFIIRHVLKQQGKQTKVGEMEMRDWNPFGSNALDLIVGLMENTGRTTICTCHENAIYQSDPKDLSKKTITGYEPAFQGKVGDNLAAFFTDVWRLEQRQAPGGKSESWMQTVGTGKCNFLKNSLLMPSEINVTNGYVAIEQYLKGKI
jgi:hypothetical protein